MIPFENTIVYMLYICLPKNSNATGSSENDLLSRNMSECTEEVRELLQICLGQKCINYLANFSLFRSTSSLSKKCINYVAKFRLLKWFLFFVHNK